MNQGEREIVEAAERACRDFMNGTGAFYAGPACGIYLRVLGVLQTEQAKLRGDE